MLTKIESTRDVVNREGEQQFRIITVCTDRGDLPDIGLFVKEIIDADDHTQDSFVRIVDIVDFQEYLADRTDAIHAGALYWRDYILSKYYTDVEVADAAKTAISDRVNDLTQQYNTFTTTFEQDPAEELSFPTEEDTAIQATKTAYSTAYTAYTAADSAATVAAADKTEAEDTLSDANDAADLASMLYTSASARTAEMTAAWLAMNTFNGHAQTFEEAVQTFITAYDNNGGSGVTTQRNTLEEAHNVFVANRTPFTTSTNEANAIGITNHQNHAQKINMDLLQPANGVKITAEADLNNKSQALTEAEAAVQTAYATLETAYNNVKDICPTWTPDEGQGFPPTP